MTAVIRADDNKTIAFPFLEKAIKMGGHDWLEICQSIDNCHRQLWLAVTDTPIAALVTQATEENALECLIAGGTGAKQWAGVAEARFSAFASQNDLNHLRIWGRKGWQRYFPHWDVVGVEDGLMILERAV